MSSRASQRPGQPGAQQPGAHQSAAHQPGAHDEPPAAPPAPPAHDPEPYEPDARPDHEPRPTFERILPELIRRGLEAGRGPLEKVSESIFPKEIASQLVSQLVDVRSGVVKAVAQEVGRFLREADIASELRKVMTGMTIEAKVQLKFNQREDGSLSPKLDVKLDDASERKKSR